MCVCFHNAEQCEAGGEIDMGSTERTPLLKPEDRVVQVKDLTMLF